MNVEILPPLVSEDSVLFLGAGFSRDASNLRNRTVPDSDGLKSELASLIGMKTSDYPLQVLASEAIRREADSVYHLLCNSFTISESTPDQQAVLSRKWQRIYTTNYDNLVEHVRGPTPDSFSFKSSVPPRVNPNSIIHLHGHIRECTSANLAEQLVLTEESYARQHFEISDWNVEFVQDLKYCDAIYFVGYGLRDYLLSSLLLQNPVTRDKTFFIDRLDPDELFVNTVSQYGRVVPIGVSGFAKRCAEETVAPAPIADIRNVKSFRYLDPRPDRRATAPPTSNEVYQLLTFGTFKFDRAASTLSDNSYVIAREKLNDATQQLGKSRCLVIHSRLGNGKTIFAQALAAKLSLENYRCVLFKEASLKIAQELQMLSELEKLVVIFDGFAEYADEIKLIAERLPQAKLVVCIRTAQYDVRLFEIDQVLPKPVARMRVDNLSATDRRELSRLCRAAGIGQSKEFDNLVSARSEMRDILLGIFKSQHMREKIKSLFAPIFADAALRKVFLTTFILNWAGSPVDAYVLRDLTGTDAFVELRRSREISTEVLSFDDDRMNVRSSVFSEFVVRTLAAPDDLFAVARHCALYSARRKVQRRYYILLSQMLKYSTLHRFIEAKSDGHSAIVAFYEELRDNERINEEPLFWLQFAIAMCEARQLPQAQEYIQAAYKRAAEREGYRTYQIDTQALRILLLVEAADTNDHVQQFERLIELLERAESMLGEESHRYYLVGVLENVEPFVTARINVLDTGERNALVFWLNRISGKLKTLPAPVKALTGSNAVFDSLERAISNLIK